MKSKRQEEMKDANLKDVLFFLFDPIYIQSGCSGIHLPPSSFIFLSCEKRS